MTIFVATINLILALVGVLFLIDALNREKWIWSAVFFIVLFTNLYAFLSIALDKGC